MKKLIALTAAVALLSTAALAEAPNRVTMSFEEFVEASGCVIVDMGGYNNLAAVDGGSCPSSVVTAFNGVGGPQGINPGPDGTLGTADDYSVTVSDN